MSARYALYFAPQSTHPLWRAGCDWLGRDALSGANTQPAAHADIPALERLTSAPRRYGFHATIKAPFALTPGITVQDLSVALTGYARTQRTFAMPPLKVALLDTFLALVPDAHAPQLTRVEREVVTQFDAFRAAMTETDLKQRRAASLDSLADELLLRWGYPHVLERFRFHLSLTNSLAEVDAATCARVTASATAHFEQALSVPLAIDALCIFEEPDPDADFRLLRRFPFGA